MLVLIYIILIRLLNQLCQSWSSWFAEQWLLSDTVMTRIISGWK